MAHPRIATGMYAPSNLPMSDIRMLTAMARLDRLDSLFVYDHFRISTPPPCGVGTSAGPPGGFGARTPFSSIRRCWVRWRSGRGGCSWESASRNRSGDTRC